MLGPDFLSHGVLVILAGLRTAFLRIAQILIFASIALFGIEGYRELHDASAPARLIGTIERCGMEALEPWKKRTFRVEVKCDQVAAQKAQRPDLDFKVHQIQYGVVEFITQAGVKTRAKTAAAPQGAKIGDTIAITYDPDNPTDVRGHLTSVHLAFYGLPFCVGLPFLGLWRLLKPSRI